MSTGRDSNVEVMSAERSNQHERLSCQQLRVAAGDRRGSYQQREEPIQLVGSGRPRTRGHGSSHWRRYAHSLDHARVVSWHHRLLLPDCKQS